MDTNNIFIPIIDFIKIDSAFKSTDFLTEHNNPDKILIKNGLLVNNSKYISMGNISMNDTLQINLLIEKTTEKYIFNKISNHRVTSLAKTYYSLSNLLVNKKNIYSTNYIAELYKKFDKYYEFKNMNISKEDKVSKNLKKDLLVYLLSKQIFKSDSSDKSRIKLDYPIKIVMQDTNLHDNSFGDSFTYYITEAILD